MNPLLLDITLFLAKFIIAFALLVVAMMSLARLYFSLKYAAQNYGKRPFIIFALLIVCVVLAFAFASIDAHGQTRPAAHPRIMATTTGTHYVQWTWTAPTSGVAAAAYNVYQAIGTCTAPSAYTLMASSVSTTSWQQTVLPTSTTCTYVTAISAVGVEGPPSLGFQLDLTPPGAPSQPTPAYH